MRIIHRCREYNDIFKTEQRYECNRAWTGTPRLPLRLHFQRHSGMSPCWPARPTRQRLRQPGATNVLRIGGKGAAVAVLIFDVLKGMLPVWGAWALGLTPFWLGLVAIAACVGHIWPVFFHFRGGKGVATAFGAIAPIGLDLTGVMAGTWLLTILLSGYSSLGAIVSALIAPFYVWWFKPQYTFPVSMLSCLILLRHHDNIQRLWRRQESKIWTREKKKKTPEQK